MPYNNMNINNVNNVNNQEVTTMENNMNTNNVNNVNNQEVTTMENNMNINQEVTTMENNMNINQEVTAMELTTEEYAIQLTNALNGITATLLFEGDAMTEEILSNITSSLEYVLLGAEDVAPITITRVKHPKQALSITGSFEYPITIEDTATGRNEDYYITDKQTSKVLVDVLNAVFTGTSFVAGMGTNSEFTRQTLAEERHKEACEKALEEVKLLREKECNASVLTMDAFMKKCECHGGNWTAMMLSGIKHVAPEVFEALPDVTYSFEEICFIVNHLCIDSPHLRAIHSLGSKNGILYRTNEGAFAFRPMTDEEADMGTVALFEHLNGKVID